MGGAPSTCLVAGEGASVSVASTTIRCAFGSSVTRRSCVAPGVDRAVAERATQAKSMRIPAGTQPNQVFRLRSKGVPFLDGSGRGDHYVHVAVRIPTSLNDEQRRLLTQLAQLDGENPPEEKGVLDKVKDFFS